MVWAFRVESAGLTGFSGSPKPPFCITELILEFPIYIYIYIYIYMSYVPLPVPCGLGRNGFVFIGSSSKRSGAQDPHDAQKALTEPRLDPEEARPL